METPVKTKLQILKETKYYYSKDINRRALNDEGKCMYITPDGKNCGVGRCLINPGEYKGDVKTIAESISDDKYKKRYQGHNANFWMDIQDFHDTSEYWDKDGLSELGKENYSYLVKKYS